MEVFICLYFTQLVQLTFIFSLLNVLFPLITTPVLLCLKFSAFPCGLHIYCFFFSFISDYSSWFYFFVFLVFLPVFLAWLPSFYPSVKSVASIFALFRMVSPCIFSRCNAAILFLWNSNDIN